MKYCTTLYTQEVSTHVTVCPGSSDPFYIANLLYKMGHYFLNILNMVTVYEMGYLFETYSIWIIQRLS